MKVSGILNMLKNRMQRESLYVKADYWDAKATQLDGKSISMWPNAHLNELYHSEQLSFLSRCLSSLSHLSGRDLLDVGCGIGRFSRHMASLGYHVTGIDFSAETIKVARAMSRDEAIDYRVGSVFDLDDVERYDLALTWGCLTVACADEVALRAALMRIVNATRPGGALIFVEPIHQGFLHRVLDLRLDDFISILRSLNVEIVCVEQLHFWPVRLLLCYFDVPPRITQFLYALGQQLLSMGVLHDGGDYKAIVAIKHRRSDA